MKAGVHVYGSRRGYETLCRSPDVTDAEDLELAGLGFGQSNDPAVLAGLAAAPTALGRQLKEGRFAVTRALPGPPDDAGRPTLLLCSLLFEADDYVAAVRHHLPLLLEQHGHWDLERLRLGQAFDVRLPAPSGRRVTERDLRLADAWLQARGHLDRVAVAPLGAEADVLGLPRVLAPPDALACRWGVRLLSLDAGAELATLCGRGLVGRRRAVSCTFSGPYRSAWIEFLASTGEIFSKATLPLVDRDTVVERLPAAQGEARPTLCTPPRLRIAVGMFLGLLAALMAGLWVAALGRRDDRVVTAAPEALRPQRAPTATDDRPAAPVLPDPGTEHADAEDQTSPARAAAPSAPMPEIGPESPGGPRRSHVWQREPPRAPEGPVTALPSRAPEGPSPEDAPTPRPEETDQRPDPMPTDTRLRQLEPLPPEALDPELSDALAADVRRYVAWRSVLAASAFDEVMPAERHRRLREQVAPAFRRAEHATLALGGWLLRLRTPEARVPSRDHERQGRLIRAQQAFDAGFSKVTLEEATELAAELTQLGNALGDVLETITALNFFYSSLERELPGSDARRDERRTLAGRLKDAAERNEKLLKAWRGRTEQLRQKEATRPAGG